MLTDEFMPIAEGDELKFVVLSQNYTKAEKTIKYQQSVKDYTIDITSGLAKLIKAIFKIKSGCPQGLENTMIAIFSNHVKQDVKNMSQCQVTFEFSE